MTSDPNTRRRPLSGSVHLVFHLNKQINQVFNPDHNQPTESWQTQKATSASPRGGSAEAEAKSNGPMESEAKLGSWLCEAAVPDRAPKIPTSLSNATADTLQGAGEIRYSPHRMGTFCH